MFSTSSPQGRLGSFLRRVYDAGFRVQGGP